MEPKWAYFWEFDCPGSRTRQVTVIPLTPEEFVKHIAPCIPDANAEPLPDGRIDRNVVPYREPGVSLKPPLPNHEAPDVYELRAVWRMHEEPEIRRLILEILALQRSLKNLQEWYDRADKSTKDRGELGGPAGKFQQLRHLLRKERRRAGLY